MGRERLPATQESAAAAILILLLSYLVGCRPLRDGYRFLILPR